MASVKESPSLVKLSVVATLYKSAETIEEFYVKSTRVARQHAGDDYEIVLVNDGSPDDSVQRAINIAERDPHVLVVDLSRNFGHHKAMMCGLSYAKGAHVFLIDCDLEEEPEWLSHFFSEMEAKSADVVFGVQLKRKGGAFERISGNIYYTIFNWLVDIEHHRNITTARLMTASYVKALLCYTEREMVISCLWPLAGFKQVPVVVKKLSKSKSTYTLRKKITLFVNSITSFSTTPLHFIFEFGCLITFFSFAYAAKLIFFRIFFSESMAGWTSVMVSIWCLGGLIISFIGIIGLYLGKTFLEVKRRPSVIVRGVYGSTQ